MIAGAVTPTRDSTMSRTFVEVSMSYRWMPIMGEFETSDDRIVLKGARHRATHVG
jgi:hypothetical protein